MPGKKFPGHFGDEIVTVKNVLVVDVIPEENVVLVKGPVPGAPRSLVQLMKVN
jgi:large subunit ribosomal protein L3